MKTKHLVSFVGNKDGTEFIKGTGPILTIFKQFKFQSVYLIWTSTPQKTDEYFRIAEKIKAKLLKEKLSKRVFLCKMELLNPTDHNEIYPKLLSFCKKELINPVHFTAAIASGTPAMQVCWILMSESGDFPLKLIRSNEPEFGKEIITSIKLDTNLPRIKKLEKQNIALIKENEKILPDILMYVKEPILYIGDREIILHPKQFSYYRYFLMRAYYEKAYLKVVNNMPPPDFISDIERYFRESYPGLSSRGKTSFLSNITRINIRIKESLNNIFLSRYYIIENQGRRGTSKYGINIKPKKIKIIK